MKAQLSRSVQYGSRWFDKFSSDCKNVDDQEKSGRPKTVDSDAGELHTESIRRAPHLTVSCGFVTIRISAKASGTAELCFTLPKYRKTFDSLLDFNLTFILFFICSEKDVVADSFVEGLCYIEGFPQMCRFEKVVIQSWSKKKWKNTRLQFGPHLD